MPTCRETGRNPKGKSDDPASHCLLNALAVAADGVTFLRLTRVPTGLALLCTSTIARRMVLRASPFVVDAAVTPSCMSLPIADPLQRPPPPAH